MQDSASTLTNLIPVLQKELQTFSFFRVGTLVQKLDPLQKNTERVYGLLFIALFCITGLFFFIGVRQCGHIPESIKQTQMTTCRDMERCTFSLQEASVTPSQAVSMLPSAT
ncbi:hypothetical protein CesoFtcFv8_020603 [Champsocephalus esox]|uniref:Uncharacterized protein n=1 Tax=Champsocephalus esox TaxID=159716 RepID=A0AAN8BC23_9TELE|nr:hypothetical protein CesoFtcFv8_020603 [Champsocephalus esox]